MNLTPNNNPLIAQHTPVFNYDSSFEPQSQWNNLNDCSSNQIPLQLSQYYNIFPEVPTTKTSWTFPNDCTNSNFVSFTGDSTDKHEVKFSCTPISKKRKSVENVEKYPDKIFITEEKMAARMNCMHISNDFISHSNIIDDTNTNNDEEMDDNMRAYTGIKNVEPRFVICDELKKLNKQLNNNSIIPESLVSLNNFSTALVLWRPPMSYLNVVNVPSDEEEYSRSSVVITDITDRPDLDNNNILDLNPLNSTSTVEYPQDCMEIMEM